jgi:hypothetical protein
MKQDDDRISMLLKADAEELGRMADLPTAHSILWEGKIRATRKRRQRVAGLIALIEILGASGLALVIVGLVWRALLSTAVSAHPLTIAALGALTLVAISVCAAASFIAVGSKAMSR